jgi:hypothetical protein
MASVLGATSRSTLKRRDESGESVYISDSPFYILFTISIESMSRFHCRCRKCDARKVLKLKPEEYKVQPQCMCGQRDFRIDKWMQTRNTKAAACFCGGYHFKHRMSSLYCFKRKDGTERYPGDHDFWSRDMTQEDHDALVAQRLGELNAGYQ